MIPDSYLQQLLDRLDLLEIVRRHVKLKKTGANWVGLCPFHTEKTPSFSVSNTKQFYYCFGCGEHGTAITFLMKKEGYDFRDAVKLLSQAVGMTMPQEEPDTPETVQAKETNERLREVLEKTHHYYKQQLKQSSVAIAYLKERGISGNTAAAFGIGYAPDGYHNLQSVFSNYSDADLELSGLVTQKENGKRFDRFRHRVLFPLADVRGNLIGFGGRSLDGTDPKYLNSPETPLFTKGRELYGLSLAKKHIQHEGVALVTEGYFDVITLHQNGIQNAVATSGTAVSADQIKKLLRFTDKICFCFDGDAAGKKAAQRAMLICLDEATDRRLFTFLFLPAKDDPDSFVRSNGADAFLKLQSSAMPLSKLLLKHCAADVDLSTLEGRAAMVDTAKPLLQRLKNAPALMAALQAELSNITAISPATITAGKNKTFRSSKARAPLTLPDHITHMLIDYPALRQRADIDMTWLQVPGLENTLLTHVLMLCQTPDFYEVPPAEFIKALYNLCDSDELSAYLDALLAHKIESRLTPEEVSLEFSDASFQLAQRWRRFEIERLRQLAASNEISPEERDNLDELIRGLK